MNKVLIITDDRHFKSSCASALRAEGYHVMTQTDIYDGLKELKWYGPDAFIWHFPTNSSTDNRAMALLIKNFTYIPGIINVDDDSYPEISEIPTFTRAISATIDQVTDMIKRMAPIRPEMPNFELED